MAQAITTRHHDPIGEMASLPPSLTAIFNAKGEAAVWQLQSAPAAIIAAAKQVLPAYLADVDQIATKEDRERWLLSLGMLSRSQLTADEAKAQIRLYASLLEEHPKFVFSPTSLRAAARKFVWWPSFSEIDEFLSDQSAPHRLTISRLRRLIQLPTDEEVAARKAAENAARLEKLLATPAGRVRHRHWNKFSRHPGPLNWIGRWFDLVENLANEFGEELVDAWHAEVAALNWQAEGFSALDELRKRAVAARAKGGAS